jgi:hypothetical protein
MYARIATFEGIPPNRIDEQVAEMRRVANAVRAGTPLPDTPAEVRTLVDTLSRFVYVVDRESGTGVGISFTENEDDMRRADAAMNAMPPGDPEDGRRTGPAEIFEVVMFETYTPSGAPRDELADR